MKIFYLTLYIVFNNFTLFYKFDLNVKNDIYVCFEFKIINVVKQYLAKYIYA